MTFKYPDIFDNWMRLVSQIAHLRQTGQETEYQSGDDGTYQAGVAARWEVLTTGRFSGTTNITINGKTHALSNNCVRDRLTLVPEPIMWARYVPDDDIGPAEDGSLFWQQWTLTGQSVTFNAAAKTITAAAGTPFDTGALCAGRIFTVAGTVSNDGTYTVTNITTSIITVSEALVNEGPVATNFATVDDLIWDFLDEANANALGGYTDWRVSTSREFSSLINYGTNQPAIDTTAFPSTPSQYYWTSSTLNVSSIQGWRGDYIHGGIWYNLKKTTRLFCRLVRGGPNQWP